MSGSQAAYTYLSFQRPPPSRVAPGEAVGVSPLICSDLRDLVHTPAEPLLLRLQWVVLQQGQLRAVPKQEPVSVTWSGPQDAYRVTTLTAPALRHDAELRLAMWAEHRPATHKRRKNGEADLGVHLCTAFDSRRHADDALDALPIPVVTGPIRVGRGAAGNDKVDSTSRLFTLGRQERYRVLEIREQTGFALDKHVWDAAMHLSRLLVEVLPAGAAEVEAKDLEMERTARNHLQSLCTAPSLRVVELGAGTAMLSIMLAALWNKRTASSPASSEDDAPSRTTLECWATDLEPALSLIDTNIGLNSASLAARDDRSVLVRSLLLDWDAEKLPAELRRTDGAAADIVLASDCTYNPSSFTALARTIARLLSSSSSAAQDGPGPLALLAKKHRHIDEEALWDTLAAHRLSARLIAGRAPSTHDDADYEGWGIWLLTLDAA